MKVCFSGDLFLGGDLLFEKRGSLVSAQFFEDADCRVVNVEQAISDSGIVADKCTLYTNSSVVATLKNLRINVVNLANNHIQDSGLNGVPETVLHLARAGIDSFGAGENITQARKPYKLEEGLVLLSYCDFDKPYLKQVAVATEESPGVNPLDMKMLMGDLDLLADGQKAILQFHWGREHLFFPPPCDIELAKVLLADERVLSIVGMHAHRIQGVVRVKGKSAYMCLGNFLFPNFYIKPRTQLYNPDKKITDCMVTQQYHDVYDVTYKKWKLVNRVSMHVLYDTDKEIFSHRFTVQDRDKPEVRELNLISRVFVNSLVLLLSSLYSLPCPVYGVLYRVTAAVSSFSWLLGVYFFKIRQLGIVRFITIGVARARKKSH